MRFQIEVTTSIEEQSPARCMSTITQTLYKIVCYNQMFYRYICKSSPNHASSSFAMFILEFTHLIYVILQLMKNSFENNNKT